MSIYLATFGKLRYLGLLNLTDSADAAVEAANDEALADTRWVLLETMRGTEMGMLAGKLLPEQAESLSTSCLQDNSGERPRGPEPMLQEVAFAGFAENADIEEYYKCRAEEEDVLLRSREILVTNHKLEMKLVDTEYMLDRRKLFFYFTSEQRIDFRAYVRDLAREFKTRIEMRQIGVRDEARVVEGISPCGRPCCCSYWLHQFTPIGIRMVKEQKLALNPTKISGICGRLMCCMAYEHENYEDLWRTLPGPGVKIKTPQGTYMLDSVDLGTEHVRIKFPSGRVVPISIAEFKDFQEAVLRGEEWSEEFGSPVSFRDHDISTRAAGALETPTQTSARARRGLHVAQEDNATDSQFQENSTHHAGQEHSGSARQRRSARIRQAANGMKSRMLSRTTSAGKPDRLGNPDRADKTDRIDRVDKVDKIERIEKVDKISLDEHLALREQQINTIDHDRDLEFAGREKRGKHGHDRSNQGLNRPRGRENLSGSTNNRRAANRTRDIRDELPMQRKSHGRSGGRPGKHERAIHDDAMDRPRSHASRGNALFPNSNPKSSSKEKRQGKARGDGGNKINE